MQLPRLLPILFLVLTASHVLAQSPPELVELRSHYDQTQLATHETVRVTYIRELVALRAKFEDAARQSGDYSARDAVEAEMIRYPAPYNADFKALAKALVGRWRSPRHDYLYRADGTWVMLGPGDNPTHGSWSIKGNQETENFLEPYTIILIDKDNFIRASATNFFYEKRLVEGTE
jgi:hypothetical protein